MTYRSKTTDSFGCQNLHNFKQENNFVEDKTEAFGISDNVNDAPHRYNISDAESAIYNAAVDRQCAEWDLL